MSDSDTNNDMVVAEFSPTLGRRLREAREEKGMTIPEVATQLRLTKDMVQCLETDQWDKMRGRIYARGYFVSYVKFLGLPYDVMMAVFDAEYSATEPALKLSQHGQPVQSKTFPWMLLVSSLIVLAMVILAYLQWQNNQQQLAAVAEQSAESAEQAGVEDEQLVEPFETEQESVVEQTPEIDADSDNLDEIAAMELESQQTPATESTIPESESSDIAVTLQIQFQQECWVEIRNGDAGVLISKVMRAGESLQYESSQPFDVLLGRADAATVTYNNEAVNLAPFTQGDIARVTLGAES
jgi:cytoskeleton protein RodZ